MKGWGAIERGAVRRSHICQLYYIWHPSEGFRGENLQGLSELFAPLLPHLDHTPLPSIKGKDAADGLTGGWRVRLRRTHTPYTYRNKKGLHICDIQKHACTDIINRGLNFTFFKIYFHVHHYLLALQFVTFFFFRFPPENAHENRWT